MFKQFIRTNPCSLVTLKTSKISFSTSVSDNIIPDFDFSSKEIYKTIDLPIYIQNTGNKVQLLSNIQETLVKNFKSEDFQDPNKAYVVQVIILTSGESFGKKKLTITAENNDKIKDILEEFKVFNNTFNTTFKILNKDENFPKTFLRTLKHYESIFDTFNKKLNASLSQWNISDDSEKNEPITPIDGYIAYIIKQLRQRNSIKSDIIVSLQNTKIVPFTRVLTEKFFKKGLYINTTYDECLNKVKDFKNVTKVKKSSEDSKD